MTRKHLLTAMLAAMLPAVALTQDDCNITLPWSEDFDSYASEGYMSKPDCWTRLVPFQVSSTAQRPNLASVRDHGKVLVLRGDGSGSGTMKIATPLIPAAMNGLEITFEMSGAGLMVYAATDTADEGSYALIGTFNTNSTYTWTPFELHTDTIAGLPSEQGFLVFAGAFGSSGYSTARLDNLTVSQLSGCDRTASVSVDNIGPEGALVSWPSVEGAQGYRVSYNIVDDLTTAEWEDTEDISLTLSGLQAGTQYYVWVQTVCGDELLSGTRGATFTTQLACYDLLNLRLTSFSSDMVSFAWDIDVRGHEATGVYTELRDLTDTAAEVVTGPSMGMNFHVFTNLDRSHEYEATFRTVCSQDDSASGITIPFAFPACGESMLHSRETQYDNSFPLAVAYQYSYSQMIYSAEVLYGMDTLRGIALHRSLDEDETNAPVRTLSIWLGLSDDDTLTSLVDTSGLTQVANGVSYTLGAQEWDTLLFTTPFVYDGSSNVLVYIRDNTGSGMLSSQAPKWYWHPAEGMTIYNFSTTGSFLNDHGQYKQPDLRFVGQCNDDYTCEPPVVYMSDVDSVNAVIEWQGGSADAWVVEYRLLGSQAWTVAASDWTYSSYTFADLSPSSHYEARVGVVCDSVVRYSEAVPFSTLCALIYLPFHFTQANMVAAYEGGFADCWHWANFARRKDSETGRAFVQNLGDDGIWFMLPPTAEPIENVRFSTLAASSTACQFKVGVASMDDCSDVVWVDTIDVQAGGAHDSPRTYTSYITTYTDGGNRLVVSPMVTNAYHFLFFYDFHLEAIDECLPVSEVVFDSADAASLSFHWTPRGSAVQWVVYIDGEERTTVDEPHCTIDGLEAYTLYTVGVRSLCDGDTSVVATATMRTGCAGDECTVTLVGHSSIGEGWHGAHLHADADGQRLEDFTLLMGTDRSTTMRVCQSLTLSLTWLSGNTDNICSFELLNAAGDTLYAAASGADLTSGIVFATDSICSYVPGCTNRFFDTTVEACDSYLWHGRTLTESGIYVDTVVGAVESGCDSIYTLTLLMHSSSATELTVTAEDSYTWHGNTYTVSGTYTYTTVNSEGCDSVVTLHLTVNSSSATVELVAASGLVAVHPNPTTGRIRLNGTEIKHVEVYDAVGRKVLEANGSDVDISHMPSGIYSLRVVLPDGSRQVLKVCKSLE